MKELYSEMNLSVDNPRRNSNLNRELENKIESGLIKMLEDKLKISLDETEGLKADHKSLELDILSLKKDLGEMTKNKNLAENQILRIKDLKNVFEKEVGKLKVELSSHKNHIKNLNRKINSLEGNVGNLQEEQEKGIKGFSSESDYLKEKISHLEVELEEITEEREELRMRLQEREKGERKALEEKRNVIKELEKKNIDQHEKKLEKITRLINENANLSEKLAETEAIRKRYYEKNKILTKEVSDLHSIIEDVSVENKKLKKEAKDVRLARSANTKVLENKIISQGVEIKKFKEIIEKLKKENNKLKKIEPKNRYDNFEENEFDMMPVKAKPTLFGESDF